MLGEENKTGDRRERAACLVFAQQRHEHHAAQVSGLKLFALPLNKPQGLIKPRGTNRDDKSAPFPELPGQGLRHMVRGTGYNNGVKWGVFRPTIVTIVDLTVNIVA